MALALLAICSSQLRPLQLDGHGPVGSVVGSDDGGIGVGAELAGHAQSDGVDGEVQVSVAAGHGCG